MNSEKVNINALLPTGADQVRLDSGVTRDLGLLTLAFLSDWGGWIERRVESVTFPDEATVRRQVSVDFAVPSSWVSPLPTVADGEQVFYIPVAMLRKQGLVDFDLRDESGKAVPLLTRDQNGLIAAATLVQLAEAVGAEKLDGNTSVPRSLCERFAEIADGPESEALSICSAFSEAAGTDSSRERAWRRALSDDEKFMSLAHDFARGFLLICPVVGNPGERRILKYSYEASAPSRRSASWTRRLGRGMGWRPRTEQISAPSIGQCRCFHLEIEAPDGLQVTRATLSSEPQPRPSVWNRANPDVIKPGAEKVHLHLSAPGVEEGYSIVNLRARPAIIDRAALVTAILTALALALVTWRHNVLQWNLDPTTQLLLLVPAALSVYVARPREPIVTTGLLFGQRVLAVMCGGLSVAGAALLLVGQECSGGSDSCAYWGVLPWLLVALTLAAATIAAILTMTVVWTASPPERARV